MHVHGMKASAFVAPLLATPQLGGCVSVQALPMHYFICTHRRGGKRRHASLNDETSLAADDPRSARIPTCLCSSTSPASALFAECQISAVKFKKMPMATKQQIIGSSAQMRSLREVMSLASGSAATVLISGESGSGKELVAQALHNGSPRAKAAFVPINCAAIPRDLLESELFGHRKGAFSGAIADRKGRFELANGGTLFLDEIGDMPAEMQVKLLRVLQEGVIDPVGSTGHVPVDVRVVAATHRDLEAECAAGRFREDLFFRLNVLPIKVPPLRERREDIPLFIEHFSKFHAQGENRPITFENCLAQAMQEYAWPGNIRELSNLLFRLSVLYPMRHLSTGSVPRNLLPTKMEVDVSIASAAAGDSIDPDGGPVEGAADNVATNPRLDRNPVEDIILVTNGGAMLPKGGLALKDYLYGIEKNIIEQALIRTGGNVSKTAQLLRLQRTTLIQKMNKLKRDGDGAFQPENPLL